MMFFVPVMNMVKLGNQCNINYRQHLWHAKQACTSIQNNRKICNLDLICNLV